MHEFSCYSEKALSLNLLLATLAIFIYHLQKLASLATATFLTIFYELHRTSGEWNGSPLAPPRKNLWKLDKSFWIQANVKIRQSGVKEIVPNFRPLTFNGGYKSCQIKSYLVLKKLSHRHQSVAKFTRQHRIRIIGIFVVFHVILGFACKKYW